MKKVLIIMMVLLAVTTTAVFAKQGFTLRGGFSYDFVNVKSVKTDQILDPLNDKTWRANAFGAEFGVTYNFSDSFLVYGDSSVGFYKTFKLGGTEVQKPEGTDKMFFVAQTSHVGAAYDFDFGSALDLQVGGGLAVEFARMTFTDVDKSENESVTTQYGVLALGFGLYANVGYSLSDRVSVTATVHPDFMIVSSNVLATTTTTTNGKHVHEITDTNMNVGTAFSFKFNASVGVTFKF